MKRLLYVGITLLVAILTYFIGCKDWLKGDKKQENPKDVVFTPSRIDQPIPNEYIISMPKNPKSKEYIEYKNFLDKHFLEIQSKSICPCNQDLQMWTAKVDFEPDKDPPTTGSSDTSVFLSRNYSITLDESISFKSNLKALYQKGNVVKIAILDTGVDTTIGTLAGFLHKNPSMSFMCNSTISEGVYGMNMLYITREQPNVEPIDADGHGTFINGIMAGLATYPPHYSKQELALNVSLDVLNVKIGANKKTGSTLFKTLCGMYYAVKSNANLINASWRVSPRKIDINSVAQSFIPVLTEMKKSNMMLVASAGNDSKQDLMHLPSAFARPFTFSTVVGSSSVVADFSDIVVSVGAWSTSENDIADFSNRGSNVDIYAPGELIRSLNLGGSMKLGSGTSYATPFVTQRLAELMGENPRPMNLKANLMSRHSRTIRPDVKLLIMR